MPRNWRTGGAVTAAVPPARETGAQGARYSLATPDRIARSRLGCRARLSGLARFATRGTRIRQARAIPRPSHFCLRGHLGPLAETAATLVCG